MEHIQKYDWSTTQRREDGSYVVMKDGLPCHLPKDDPAYAAAWKMADDYANSHDIETVPNTIELLSEDAVQQFKAETQRVPDLEDATLDLASYTSELEDKVKELEGRITEMEARLNV